MRTEAARLKASDPDAYEHIWLGGYFLGGSGRVYSSFLNKPYPAGNIDEEIEDPGGELLVGMDFNVNPMSATIAVRAVDECLVLDALEIMTSNTEEMAGEIRRRYPRRPVVVCPDPTGSARKTSAPVGQTDFTILERAGFEVRAPAKAPPVVDRVNNANAMYFQDGRRRVRIHPNARVLITALANLTYKEGTSIRDKKSGFDHIAITPNLQVYKRLAIKGFKEQGRPKMPFVTGISTVTIKVALKFGIPLIMYGEEGETEYGGSTRQTHRRRIDRQYLADFYYSGHDPVEYLDEFTRDEIRWWLLPSQEELDEVELFPTHWSHFENWDPELHAKLAQEKCGLQTLDSPSAGTYSNYAQLDDVLQDLHAYMMFIKFGFGRTTSDAGIDIRVGRLTREEGAELVKKYDGRFPEQYLTDFLEYFEMTEDEFWAVVDSFANTEVLEKVDGRWRLKPAMVRGLEKGGEFSL